MEEFRVTFFFRADANQQIGSGHIIRCRILARELRNFNYTSAFIIKNTDEKFKTELIKEGFSVYAINNSEDDTKQIIDIINSSSQAKKMLVIDSDEPLLHQKEFQLNCISNGILLMHIVFTNEYTYYSHIVHNQNPIALEKKFDIQPYTKTLFGLNYVILDPSFQNTGHHPKPQNIIFISFGGSDKPNRTLALLKVLNDSNFKIDKAIIILGLIYPFRKELEYFLQNDFQYKYELHQNTNKISSLMEQSSVGITSGGFTIWELGLFNIKTAIISYTEREQITASYLDEKKLSCHIGNIKTLSYEQFKHKLNFVLHDESLERNADRLFNLLNPNGRIIVTEEMIKMVN
jgi:spore coat polysaccharide biosynthesis predicted glycosyltransferase SpsG